MAFIRTRGNSHQLIETYREDGKVRQRILANLGPHRTLEDAIRAGVVSESITSAKEDEKPEAEQKPTAPSIMSTASSDRDTTARTLRRLHRWWSSEIWLVSEERVKQWNTLIIEFAERNGPIQGVNVVDDTTQAVSARASADAAACAP
jgi:hypothetical protein